MGAVKFRLSTFTSGVGQTTLLGRCGESEVRQSVVFEEGVGGGADAHGSERNCDDGQDACDEVADGGAAFLLHDWCLSLWCRSWCWLRLWLWCWAFSRSRRALSFCLCFSRSFLNSVWQRASSSVSCLACSASLSYSFGVRLRWH